ncbi:tRNA (guanine-N(7)-)-methyltransferase [Oceaniferula spumae]|uniref:tRNA (guanine-N(7)-)-methyltransferase n=1 Tax=Oceaniferula spumae TaxID=2979115 RepID=A0AAT9FJV6_9BACT
MSDVSQCARTPEPCEYMPDDFFRRHSAQDIFADGNPDLPLEIDLGCGDGTFLIEMAKHYPERNFLGVERLLGRVRGVCRTINNLGLKNAKVLRLESSYTLEWLLEKESVSRLHLLCPDPWPKARHHKRRLVQQHFLGCLKKVLTPEGEFLFKTDHPGYHEWVCEEMETFGEFNPQPWLGDGTADNGSDEFFYPKTDFQKLWESQGKVMHQLRFGK